MTLAELKEKIAKPHKHFKPAFNGKYMPHDYKCKEISDLIKINKGGLG